MSARLKRAWRASTARSPTRSKRWKPRWRRQLAALDEEEQAALQELDDRINETSSKAIQEAQSLQTWLKNGVGKKSTADKMLSWSDEPVIQNKEVISADHEIAINDMVQNKLDELQEESDAEKEDIRALIAAKREHVRRELGAQLDELREGIEERKERVRDQMERDLEDLKGAGREDAADGDSLSRAVRELGQRLHGRHGRGSDSRHRDQDRPGQDGEGTAPRDPHDAQQAAPQEGCQAPACGRELPQE